MAYDILIRLPIDYVLRQVRPKETGAHKSQKIRVGPVNVNRHSIRLLTFKRSTKCVACGVEGELFSLERNGNPGYHFNMYGRNEHGHLVLMTKDHIVPKSKGGSNGLDNMQTMCTKCNSKKADTMPK
jgi:hypothetical protein